MKKPDSPAWICRDCGLKYGRGMPPGHLATFHLGICGICGKGTSVTQPRDYGWLKDGWEKEKG